MVNFWENKNENKKNPVVNYPITLGYWIIVDLQLFFSSQISHIYNPY